MYDSIPSDNTDYFTNSEEYNQLLGIRNDIAHESIRSQVFYSEGIQRESFQFYTNRSLDNNICLNDVFLNPHGSEIYDLKRWLTWMLVLLLNYIDNIIYDIVVAIKDKDDNNCNKLSEIKKYDILVDNKISSLIIDNDEVSIFRNEIKELRNYIINF